QSGLLNGAVELCHFSALRSSTPPPGSWLPRLTIGKPRWPAPVLCDCLLPRPAAPTAGHSPPPPVPSPHVPPDCPSRSSRLRPPAYRPGPTTAAFPLIVLLAFPDFCWPRSIPP